MSTKTGILLFLFILGFLLGPTKVHACKSHASKPKKKIENCCSRMAHSSSHDKQLTKEPHCKKKCCDTREDGSKECSGKCGGNSCQTTSHNFSAAPLYFKYSHSQLLSIDKMLIYPPYRYPHYSSGYYTIWQPPKIG